MRDGSACGRGAIRIALLADIHGNLAALDAVEADLARRSVDHVFVLGDNLSGPLEPAATCDRLIDRGWLTLAGNHDRRVVAGIGRASDAYARAQLDARQMAWLASLPAQAEPIEGVRLLHGSARSDEEYLMEDVRAGQLVMAPEHAVRERLGLAQPQAGALPPEVPTLVACGHSHVPRAMRLGSLLVVNPGSVGLQAWDDDDPEWYAMERGTPDAHYAIVERGSDGAWRVEWFALPYDHEAMARLADARGRLEWAHALRTGRMPARG